MKFRNDKTMKYTAGDLVSQAKPREKPNISEKLKFGYFERSRDKNKDKTPKKESKLSANAKRSKKKVKGIKQ